VRSMYTCDHVHACLCVCVCVCVCVFLSLSLILSLSLSLSQSVSLSLSASIFFFLSLSCSLSCSLNLYPCVSVSLCLCVHASVSLCTHVSRVYQILSTNLTKRPVVLHQQQFTHRARVAAACSDIGEELAVYTVLIGTVRKNTQELTGLWGNGSHLISIFPTTGVQPRVKCVYVCSLATRLHLVILCGLIACTFELDYKLISYNTQSPNK